VETCGNVWPCPVCSAKIHHRRADELRTALTTWEAVGDVATLVTITVLRDLHDQLVRLAEADKTAWATVAAGAPGSA
jgi:hypothetical protein